MKATGMTTRLRPLASTLVLAVLSIGFIGCTDQTDITLHEPGVYKGSKDPLLAKETDPAYSKQLDDRFLQVQTDR